MKGSKNCDMKGDERKGRGRSNIFDQIKVDEVPTQSVLFRIQRQSGGILSNFIIRLLIAPSRPFHNAFGN